MAADYAARQLEIAVRGIPQIMDKSDNLMLIPIPTSRMEDQQKRYEYFCERLCHLLEIRNGYPYLYGFSDRIASKGVSGTRDWLTWFVHNDQIVGYDVLVFDDIYTSGRTFSAMVDSMERNGTESVTGIFLGKTIKL